MGTIVKFVSAWKLVKKVIEFPITQNARHFNVPNVFVLLVSNFEPVKGYHPGDCALPVLREIVS
jgi:hypothetical protein